MANPIPKPIIGAFEDIGEQVVSQVKSIPKDVGQAALESVGLTMGGKKTAGTQTKTPGATQDTGSNWQQIEQQTDQKAKREIARRALEELLKPSAQAKEPSIWEKMQQEEGQKQEAQKQQQTAQQASLPMPTSKPKAGYGVKQKKTQVENKATKSD